MTEADRPAPNQANGEITDTGSDGATTTPARESSPPSSQPAAPASEGKNELARLRDQLLRTAADFDNFRKRTRREVDDAQRRGRESAIKELLPVFDNLERAASHAEGAPDVKSVADGLRIVLKQFNDTLEKMGIKRVATVGTAFDPAVHEAIQHLESPDHPAGTVLFEVQPGYSMGDHLIRAAMVVVSKGPPSGSAPAS
jgi:molecular chaperone GrpE